MRGRDDRRPRAGSGIQDAEPHLAILDESKRDRVLLVAQETLRAVDGVECPEAALAAAAVPAAIDGVEHRVDIDTGQDRPDPSHDRLRDGSVAIGPERGGVFLGHQWIGRERVAKRQRDDGL